MNTAPRWASPFVLVSLALAVASGTACSISQSSQSFSDSSQSFSDSSRSGSESVSHSSRSSSGSSSPDSPQARRYEQDVADYTEAYIASGGSDGAFLRGVGDIAEERGISDWEAEEVTWMGIGRGLARVQVSEMQLQVYKHSWSAGDAARVAGIEKGYASER